MERRGFGAAGLIAGFLFGGPSVGCAAPVGPEPDAGSTQQLSVVEVRTWHAPADGALARFDAAARFVSVREPGLPSDALELLGLEWPTIPAGTCAQLDADATARPASAFRVDLRDLSPVTLRVEGDDGVTFPVALEPRAFPDVVGLVSGVVFVGPSELPSVAPAPRSVSLVLGSVPAPALDLPDVPAPVELVDATPSEAAPGTFTVDANGLDLVTPAPKGDDRIAVEIVRSGVVRARCRVDAGGKLRVGSAALGGAGEATLVVRAQRRVLREDAAGALDARLERALEVRLVVK